MCGGVYCGAGSGIYLNVRFKINKMDGAQIAVPIHLLFIHFYIVQENIIHLLSGQIHSNLEIYFTEINTQILIDTCFDRISKGALFRIAGIKIVNQN